MIEKRKGIISKVIKIGEKRGLFLSFYDKNKVYIDTIGLYMSIDSWDIILDNLKDLLPTTFDYVVGDIVSDVQLESDPEKILTLNMKERGIHVIDETGHEGTVLPDTIGVADAKNALFIIKNTDNIQGKITIYSFKTNRILLESHLNESQ